MEITFGGKYRLEEEIGYGGCGTVFIGSHTIAGKEVAIKLESAKAKRSLLKRESKIYKTLMGGPGVPWIMWSGKKGDYNVMVIDLLGPSLEDLFRVCNRHFSLKTVLLLADQLISLLEFIHSRDWVHRDVKPANFLMGPDPYSTSPDSPSKRVNIIDFGFAKKFADTRTGDHIPYAQQDTHGVGTPLFASINTHKGEECSRRDDMESLAYTLIYFMTGTLPWRKVKPSPYKSRSIRTTWNTILEVKLAAELESPSSLTAGLPEEFDIFYRYTRSLNFDATPDYRGCRGLFRALAKRVGIEYDGEFDWSVGAPGTEKTDRRKGRFCAACEARAMEAQMREI